MSAALDAFWGIGRASVDLFATMAPYLLLGVLIAGVLHVLLPAGFVAGQLGRKGLWTVLKAAAIGVPLPLCSCGVLPVAASLRKSGASRGAVVGFLVTTPITGVDSILATWSLLGAPFMLIRTAAAFVLGVVAGGIVDVFDKQTRARPDSAPLPGAASPSGKKKNAIVVSTSYALGELLGGISRPLVLGTLLGGAIVYFVPPGLLGQYVGHGFVGYVTMMAIGIPLYVCASGSIPLAAALIAAGISPGGAVVLLVAGPATNAAAIAVVSSLLGRKTLVIYLGVIALGSIGAGAATDLVFSLLKGLDHPSIAAAHVHGRGLGFFEIAGGIVLGVIVAFHLARQLRALVKKSRPAAAAAGELLLRVDQMTCENCAAAVTSAASAVPGVREVHTDLANKLVRIAQDPGQSQDAILKAIADAGFEPKRLPG